MYISTHSKYILIYYIFILIWGSSFYFLNIRQTDANYWYQFAFGLIPVVGGIFGMIKAKKWGLLRSNVGRALFFISAGTTSWGIGQMFWSIFYNIFLRVEIPYPSLADIGYIIAIPLWTIGIINLSYATGARFSLKKVKGKILLYTLPLILIALSYYLLITVARGGLLSDFSGGAYKVFFDLAYPIGDVIILSLSVIVYGLSFNYLGGRYKFPILTIIIGFIVMFVSDFSFSYVTTNGTYFNGHWVDILFPTAMALIASGVNSFDTKDT